MTITLWHYLVVSALLLGIGILTIALRRNALAILMGIQLILAAAALNFVAFNAYQPDPQPDGQILTLFLIVLGLAHAVMIVALTFNLHAQSAAPAPADPEPADITTGFTSESQRLKAQR
jgi:NADH-quinone oxidoreductase subunit K